MARKKLTHRRLAEGEATGHFHGADTGTLWLDEDGGMSFATPEETATVTHQEHGPVTVPPGTYDRLIVQEVDEDEEVREVID